MGIKWIPTHMLKTICRFNCLESNEAGNLRPIFLSMKDKAIKNILKLIKSRPIKGQEFIATDKEAEDIPD